MKRLELHRRVPLSNRTIQILRPRDNFGHGFKTCDRVAEKCMKFFEIDLNILLYQQNASNSTLYSKFNQIFNTGRL